MVLTGYVNSMKVLVLFNVGEIMPIGLGGLFLTVSSSTMPEQVQMEMSAQTAFACLLSFV